jgi:nucleotide-binding universal stress UspA family protein
MGAAETLVCGVDDSEEARNAARVAGALAERLGLELVLVHIAPAVTQPGVGAAVGGQERLARSEREEAEALLDRFVAECGLSGSVRHRVEFGDPAARLLQACEEEEAQLVVLGSRGRGKVRRALLGTVSTEVAAKAPCVVVIVPHGAAERSRLI